MLIAVFALLGIPLVAFLWETLNRLMAGWFDPFRVGVSIPVLVLLALLLRHLSRLADRLAG